MMMHIHITVLIQKFAKVLFADKKQKTKIHFAEHSISAQAAVLYPFAGGSLTG